MGKKKDLVKRCLYVLAVLVFVRAASQITVPGVNAEFVRAFFGNNEAFGFMNAFTGGGLEKFSVFALSITPYITSSIVIQLLSVVFPSLEHMQEEGEAGRRKIARLTQYMTAALALLESGSMVYGMRHSILMEASLLNGVTAVASLTAGSCILVWLGNRITEKGIGNGISMILLINILSRLPQDMYTLYKKFLSGKAMPVKAGLGAVIAAVILAVIFLTLFLGDLERKIPVQYSQKMNGRRILEDEKPSIPLKVNTAGVMPVIFASSLMAMPSMILGFLGKDPGGLPGKIVRMMSAGTWFNPASWKYTGGFVIYALLIVFFAYYYTGITFHPAEVAHNLKRAGAVIPGIRPGRSTQEYLEGILKGVIMIGAIGLVILCAIPLVLNGVTGAGVSMGGTSLIIVVSVILETVKQAKSMIIEEQCETFLNDAGSAHAQA